MKKFIIFFILLALAAGLLAGTGTTWAQGSTFSDVNSMDWFSQTVASAAEKGILSGYPDGSFRPQKNVTYGEFLAMSLFAEELEPPVRDGHWATIYYNTALAKNYAAADDFRVGQLDETIPRKHMALLLAGLAEYHGLATFQIEDSSAEGLIGITGDSGSAEADSRSASAESLSGIASVSSFTDVPEDSLYADSILLCVKLGLLSGYPDGSFRPDAGLRRCEAAAAVMNYASLMDKVLGKGSQVVLLYDSGNYVVKDRDGQHILIAGDSLTALVDPPDKQKNTHPAKLLREDHKAILDQVLASTVIRKEKGVYTFTYSQPEIDSSLHLAVDLHIYKDNSQGGSDAVFYYTSDQGWMSDSSRYNGHSQTVTRTIPLDTLQDKAIILRYLISDLEDPVLLKLGECGEYCYFTDKGVTTLYTRANRYHDGHLTKYQITEETDGCPALLP